MSMGDALLGQGAPLFGTGGDDFTSRKCGMKRSQYYLLLGLHLCGCFFFVFTAFSAIQSQSTSQFGLQLGIASTSTLYLAFAIFSLIGPFVYKGLKARWTLVVGLIGYMFLAVCAMITSKEVAANGDINTIGWVFEILGCIVCGISASYVWCAQGTYLANCASLYDDAKARETGNEKGDSMGLFGGMFFCIFQMTSITGNLIASVLFNFTSAGFTVICIVYLCFAVCESICVCGVGGEARRDDSVGSHWGQLPRRQFAQVYCRASFSPPPSFPRAEPNARALTAVFCPRVCSFSVPSPLSSYRRRRSFLLHRPDRHGHEGT